jgi:hypothetical protein
MIRFTVIWTEQAINSLAFLWTTALLRAEVTRLSAIIDNELRNDAHIKGFELREGLREIWHEKMAVTFTVSMMDRIVYVHSLVVSETLL